MIWLWLLIGVGAVLAGCVSSEATEAMMELAWKTAAGLLGFAIVGMFATDQAPSQLNWSFVVGFWAFLMVLFGGLHRWQHWQSPPDEDGLHE